MNPDGKPLACGPGDGAAEGGPRLGCGGAGPCRDTENAFILARMSGFIWPGPPRPAIEAAGGGGFPLAALRLPSGVDEAVMFAKVDVEVMSDVVRADSPGCVGLPKLGVSCSASGVASGEVGGDDESGAGERWSSEEAMLMAGLCDGGQGEAVPFSHSSMR